MAGKAYIQENPPGTFYISTDLQGKNVDSSVGTFTSRVQAENAALSSSEYGNASNADAERKRISEEIAIANVGRDQVRSKDVNTLQYAGPDQATGRYRYRDSSPPYYEKLSDIAPNPGQSSQFAKDNPGYVTENQDTASASAQNNADGKNTNTGQTTTVPAVPNKQETISTNSGEIPTVDLITGKTSVEERINPASDPGLKPGTQIFDDGSSITIDSTTGQQTVVDSDGYATITGEIPQAQQTVEATNSGDPLGDKIAELQAGQNTGTSTLSIRNQQSGIGSPKDWRFRISLAPGATYLYKDSSPGILKPLMATNGVIFPYSPQINLAYTASYNATDLVHTNYKVYNYKSSSVENISITGDFTVQDSAEANYVLAVIHFFRSVTKMFYGQDQNPARGVPPPLCYLTGFGQYQFDMHPVAITSFTYTFPNDVDYVNAYPTNNSVSVGGQNMAPYMPQIASFFSPLDRLRTLAGNIGKGGLPPPPTFVTSKNINEVTRIPAKITIQLSCIPIVSRNTMSNQFSLKQYANGSLLKGTANFSRTGGGLW
jgi:hypothetical protein